MSEKQKEKGTISPGSSNNSRDKLEKSLETEKNISFSSKHTVVSIEDLSLDVMPETLEDTDLRDKISTKIDFEILKKYVDSIFEYNQSILKRNEEANIVQNLFLDAVEKTEIETIRLNLKGEVGNKRNLQLAKRLSQNSAEISKEAQLSRDGYNKAAKTYNETRCKNKPKHGKELDKESELYFGTIFRTSLCELKIKFFPTYETAGDLRDTEEFKSKMEALTQ